MLHRWGGTGLGDWVGGSLFVEGGSISIWARRVPLLQRIRVCKFKANKIRASQCETAVGGEWLHPGELTLGTLPSSYLARYKCGRYQVRSRSLESRPRVAIQIHGTLLRDLCAHRLRWYQDALFWFLYAALFQVEFPGNVYLDYFFHILRI